MIYLIIGALVGLVVALSVSLYTVWQVGRAQTAVWRARAGVAEAQTKELMERISTSPRIEVLPPAAPTIDPDARRYIPDTPDADDAWNDYRGATVEDEVLA